MPGEPGKKRNKPELMPKPYAAARSAITRWLQPALTMSRIARQQCAETSGPKGRLLQSNVEVRIEEEVLMESLMDNLVDRLANKNAGLLAFPAPT